MKRLFIILALLLILIPLCFAGSITNFPNGVSSFGIPVIPGMELGQVWGNTYFVDAATGSDDNNGKTPGLPLLTITAAVGKVTTGKGDRIYVRDGAYTENITIAKNSFMIIGQSMSGVVVTGETDATDVVSITGNEVTIANMSFRSFDTGSDISLIKTTGDGTRIQNCDFSGGEYQIENVGGDYALIVGNHFITPDDVTDGACIRMEDANEGKIFYNGFFIDDASEGIIHHDADNLEVAWNAAVGDDDTGASGAAFVLINGADAASELMVHHNNVTLFGAVIAENSTAVAAHGLGVGDLATTASVDGMEVDNIYHGNDGLGCTVYFDSTGL